MKNLIAYLKVPEPELAPLVQANPEFPPCAELGQFIARLHEEQRAIDRAEVERLARLRELADRD